MEHKWGLLVGIYRTIIEFFNNGKTFLESSKIQRQGRTPPNSSLGTLLCTHRRLSRLLRRLCRYLFSQLDSTYMNDIWSFNTITMEWNEIQTTGDIPSHRSNCTMHYDSDNDRLIVFGGGGANKLRYDTINLLNWKNKEWTEYSPKPN